MLLGFFNKNKRLILLLIFLPYISILTRPSLDGASRFGFITNGETGVIEIIQTILLLLNLFYLLKYFNKLKLKINSKFLLIKISLLLILIYEEHSFLTSGLVDFSGEYNIQNELNIHNLKIFTTAIFENLPLFNSISVGPILVSFLLVLIGFGSYLPFSKNIKSLFLDKKFSLFAQIYSLNLFMTRILFMPDNVFLINTELIELFLYLIFLLDTKQKCAECIRSARYKSIK